MAAEGGLRGKGAAWRAVCTRCGRDTAVTHNKRTGESYYRPHNRTFYDHMQGQRVSEPCTLSRQVVDKHRAPLHPGGIALPRGFEPATITNHQEQT